MKKVVAIVGTYRKGGMTDQITDAVLESVDPSAEKEKIYLIDKDISYCTNCRTCTQLAGTDRGTCPQEDDMREILDKIEAADGLIFAAPTNFFNVTAVFRTFMERSVGYAFWPWKQAIPKPRRKKREKRAVVITASAAPAFIGRFFFGSLKALKSMAGLFGAKTVGKIYAGFAADEQQMKPSERILRNARKLGKHLV